MQKKTERTRRFAAFLTALLIALCALMPVLADTVSEPLILTAASDPQGPASGDDTAPTGDPLPEGGETEPTGDPLPEGGETEPTGDPQPEGGETEPTDDPLPEGGETEPTDDPLPEGGETEPTDGPLPDEDDPAKPEKGTATTGDFDLPVLVRKKQVQLTIPVTFRAGSESWYTNMLPSGSIVSYSAKRAVTAYSGDVTNALEYLAVSIAQTEAVPFVREKLPGAKVIIDTVTGASARELGLKADGNGGYTDGTNTYAEGDLYNTGFAVFDLVVASSVTTGEYQVPVQITWRSKLYGSGSTVVTLTAMGESGQSSADSGSTGSGGGYVSYYTGSSTKQVSEAKLIVEKVTSVPEVPTAGDEFDLKIHLHNTSKTDTVQNISLSCESDGDSILPVSGAFSAYIETIAADSGYDLVLPVQAQSDIDDKPVKLYIALEYEDSQLNAHSSTQTAVLSVSQQMRIKLDEPVLPSDNSVVGESTAVTMGVFNLGRTTLYNVTVTAQADDSNVSLGASYYCGNMDSGTGKTAELRFTPTVEGAHTVDLVVTYENNAGDLFTESRSVSFYSENYEEDDWYGDPFVEEPEATPAPSKAQQTMDVLSILPWWLYTAAGCVIVLIIVCIGVRVRHERIRALENDEME